MNIGVIGAGNMGLALATIWSKAGHAVCLSFARDPAALQQQAAALPGAHAGTPAEAARFGEVLLLAVPYPALAEALAGVAEAVAGKPVLSCVSGLLPDFAGNTIGLPTARTESVAEELARLLPTAHVVEAFNTTFAEVLQAPDRHFGELNPSLLYCGDDDAAKTVAGQLIAEAGYQPLDVGPLRQARSLETLASVWVQLAAATGLFPQAGLRILTR
ncbi:NADPH-dependent F420 reductase [Hymenobacter lapidiphilus]|uniref:NADPH-dependent F420 reductase n=1 Tax=Hymenobacter lapidiphilus TaxID=2608003 RepID=A0A7Y7U6E0_9BACT|nr:NADPH-dependent F420 reductase [Hymenobacter lapidiphilus]NVO32277.1 NADPH-dependent F420 reductase [Hymenobacter lapidiphilus]